MKQWGIGLLAVRGERSSQLQDFRSCTSCCVAHRRGRAHVISQAGPYQRKTKGLELPLLSMQKEK